MLEQIEKAYLLQNSGKLCFVLFLVNCKPFQMAVSSDGMDIAVCVELPAEGSDEIVGIMSNSGSDNSSDENDKWATAGRKRRPRISIDQGPSKKIDDKVTPTPNENKKMNGVVLIEGENRDVNRLFVAKVLFKMGINNAMLKALGRNRVRVEVPTLQMAENLCQRAELTKEGLIARLPLAAIQCKGVIRGIPTDISEKEAAEHVNSDIHIEKVERIFINKLGVKVPTNTMIIFCNGQVLPKHISLYGQRINVETYIGRVMVCYCCSRYGHSASQCRAKARCYKCGDNHQGNTCQAAVEKCVNCEGDHKANDRICPQLQAAQRERSMRLRAKAKTNSNEQPTIPMDFPSLAPNLEEQMSEVNKNNATPPRRSYGDVLKGSKATTRRTAKPTNKKPLATPKKRRDTKPKATYEKREYVAKIIIMLLKKVLSSLSIDPSLKGALEGILIKVVGSQWFLSTLGKLPEIILQAGWV